MKKDLKDREQLNIANDIMECLREQHYVSACTIHGSLAGERCDEYSDIDIQVDVSGHDNGKILLMLPYILQKRFRLRYIAFAPKFAPELYVVSFALQDTSIFHFIDIECLASPHVPSLSKEDIRQITDWKSLYAKLLIGCLKKYLRQQDYAADLQFLARQLQVDVQGQMSEVLAASFASLHNDTHGELKKVLWQGLNMIEGSSDKNRNIRNSNDD